ncbi:MAG TPA: hypothetical protein VH643_03570 [Gemmataceae bacterium]
MRRPLTRWLLTTAFMAAVLLVVALGQRKREPATPALDDWSLSELVDHLNREGLGLRMVSPQKNGDIGQAVYLTPTDKGWHDVNALTKDPRRIGEWRKIIYCESVKGRDPSYLMSQWGEDALVIGPFLFYGDRELLRRVRAILREFAPR